MHFCLPNAGGSLRGTNVLNGTHNERPVLVRRYLPQLQRPWIYVLYAATYGWMCYRDFASANSWFLRTRHAQCDTEQRHYKTSWSGVEPTIAIEEGACEKMQSRQWRQRLS